MTIDSFYFEQSRTEDGEVSFPLGYESIGTASVQVYFVDDQGNRTLTTEYTMKFEGVGPIFRDGTVEMNTPPTQSLDFLRKTAITQELDLTANAFPADAYEYSLDKLTLIFQEIDGSKCECRTYTPVDVPTVCYPYACDAFSTEIDAQGLAHWPLNNEPSDGYARGQNAPNLPIPSVSATLENISLIDDGCVGTVLTAYNWAIGTTGFIHFSDGMNVNAGPNQSGGVLHRQSGGDSINLFNMIQRYSSTGNENLTTTRYRLSQSGSVMSFIHFPFNSSSSDSTTISFDTGTTGAKFMGFSITGMPTVLTDGAVINPTITLYLDGVPVASSTDEYTVPAFGAGALTFNQTYERSAGDRSIWKSADGDFSDYFFGETGSVNWPALALAWERNKSTYTPPQECPGQIPLKCQPYSCSAFETYMQGLVVNDTSTHHWPFSNDPTSNIVQAGSGPNLKITSNRFSKTEGSLLTDGCTVVDGTPSHWNVGTSTGSSVANYDDTVGDDNPAVPGPNPSGGVLWRQSTVRNSFNLFDMSHYWSSDKLVVGQSLTYRMWVDNSGFVNMVFYIGTELGGGGSGAEILLTSPSPLQDGVTTHIGYEITGLSEEMIGWNSVDPPNTYSMNVRLRLDGVVVDKGTLDFRLGHYIDNPTTWVFNATVSNGGDSRSPIKGAVYGQVEHMYIANSGSMNWDDLALALDRNDSDYTPPPECSE